MWNYRILRFENDGLSYFRLHEVYYKDESIMAWTENPATPFGETVNGLIKALEMMLDDAKKSRKDVLDGDAPPWEKKRKKKNGTRRSR